MSIPVWSLLGFALWTVILLLVTVGVYRWTRILSGRVPIREFRADRLDGELDWYRRAMRAHANCVENLPVFGAIVFVLHVSGAAHALADTAAIVVLAARAVQSTIHVAATETNTTTSLRFSFFLVQLLAYFVLAGIAIDAAL